VLEVEGLAQAAVAVAGVAVEVALEEEPAVEGAAEGEAEEVPEVEEAEAEGSRYSTARD